MSEPDERPLDEYHAHEAMHTASVLADVVGRHLSDHAFVRAHPKLSALAQKAAGNLYELYQAIGNEHVFAEASAEGASATSKQPAPDVTEATRPHPKGNWGSGPGPNGSPGGSDI